MIASLSWVSVPADMGKPVQKAGGPSYSYAPASHSLAEATAVAVHIARFAALVDAVDRRGGAGGRRAEVDGRAAGDEGVGLGRAAVVGQGGVEDVGQRRRVVPSLVALKSVAPGVKPLKASALLWPLWPKTLKALAVTVPMPLVISSPLLSLLLPETRLRTRVRLPVPTKMPPPSAHRSPSCRRRCCWSRSRAAEL